MNILHYGYCSVLLNKFITNVRVHKSLSQNKFKDFSRIKLIVFKDFFKNILTQFKIKKKKTAMPF